MKKPLIMLVFSVAGLLLCGQKRLNPIRFLRSTIDPKNTQPCTICFDVKDETIKSNQFFINITTQVFNPDIDGLYGCQIGLLNRSKNGVYLHYKTTHNATKQSQYDYYITQSLVYNQRTQQAFILNEDVEYTNVKHLQRQEWTIGYIQKLIAWRRHYVQVFLGAGVGSHAIEYVFVQYNDQARLQVVDADKSVFKKATYEAGLLYEYRFLNVNMGMSQISLSKTYTLITYVGLGFHVPF